MKISDWLALTGSRALLIPQAGELKPLPRGDRPPEPPLALAAQKLTTDRANFIRVSSAESSPTRQRRTRRRRRDGERSRSAILDEAARLATVEGIGGLSLSRLADAVGMSKSGLFAHFESKEELQLATIDVAEALFAEQVLEPGSTTSTGLERLRQLTDGYLRYVEAENFPGGCFFASVLAEVEMQPGPVRDRLVAFLGDWLGRLEGTVREAQNEGAIDPAEDPGQLAFELEAALLLANFQFVVARTPEPIERARRAIERRLEIASVAKRG
jgi:AcrR family transcriptional regulator